MRSFGSVAGVAVLWATVVGQAVAEELYVAPDGSDTGAGTLAEPFASLERAQQAASPGDTVWIRGGEYRFSGTNRAIGVAFTKSGTPDKPIRYFAYKDEVPIFDLFELKPQERVTGLDVHCNAIHLRGLEVRGVRQVVVGDSWSVRIRGDHNVIERLNVHDGQAPGIFITSGASNLVLNSDSHHNYDPLEDGGNGDGFGCHSNGGDNVLRGCRAWANSDDGFDFINAPGTCTVERSWAFRNGFVPDTSMPAGNGAGFKSGGFGSPPKIPSTGVPRHNIRFNLAFRNRSQGFYANHHPGGLDFLNNTAFANAVNFDMLVEGGTSTHALHNNLAVGGGGTVMRFTGGDDSNNSWNLPVMVSEDDFQSMDEAQALSPRQADGNLPDIAFLHLVAGSDLIDRGGDNGEAFAAAAPDLGAFEHGQSAAVTTAPTDAATTGSQAGSGGVASVGAAGGGATRATSSAAGTTATAPSAGSAAPATDAQSAGRTSPRATGIASAGSTAPGPARMGQLAAAGSSALGNPTTTPTSGAADGCGCQITRSAAPGLLTQSVMVGLGFTLFRRRRHARRLHR
jgi:hypothetical protein